MVYHIIGHKPRLKRYDHDSNDSATDTRQWRLFAKHSYFIYTLTTHLFDRSYPTVVIRASPHLSDQRSVSCAAVRFQLQEQGEK
jgi:hypothetical protein